MIDEAELRTRFPSILWDEPEKVTITGGEETSYFGYACRYCVAMVGVRGGDVLAGRAGGVFQVYEDCLDHIREVHPHD